MQKTNRGIGRAVLAALVSLLLFALYESSIKYGYAGVPAASPGITLSIKNGKPAAPIDLVAGQEYVFGRITLEVENNDVTSSQEALEWLQNQSSFSALDWSGVRETRAHWRNYKATRPEADIFSHVFEGAAWMKAANILEISVLDVQGAKLKSPLRLSNGDFLNRLKQWDYDMIKAEFRYEDFVRSQDLSSAKRKRAVAKIVFAVQTDLSKRLRVPAEAKSLQVVWDKKPGEPYIFPIRFIPAPLRYGLQLRIKLQPQKAIYIPGETIRATYNLFDGDGNVLKFSDFARNGITRLITHLDGPWQNPTFYHEEWLNDFKGSRFQRHLRSPALGFGLTDQAASTDLEKPPFDPTGTSIVVDLHVPRNLPKEAYGTFVIGALFGRDYGSQKLEKSIQQSIQVGRKEKTEFEKFGCRSCHVPGTSMEIGLLIPPMPGAERLSIDNFQECVGCHDNSRNGSRRLDKYLHLIHQNRDNFPVAKNNCVVCHVTAASIKKVSAEVCSNCHQELHKNDRANYTDNECQGCHSDYSRGHIVPTARK